MQNIQDHNEDQKDVATRLREAGLRATGPRIAILSFLGADRTHPTVERVHGELHEAHPSLSLSTVYSTIETFIEVGLLRRIHTNEGRLRVDGTIRDHDHAVCKQCSTVFDVVRIDAPAVAPNLLPSGAQLVGVHIEYEVLCSTCSGAQSVVADIQ